MAGLDEEKASLVDDNYATVLPPREVAALQLTDAIIGMGGNVSPALRGQLQAEFSDAELVELSLGVGLFMGMSKVLICLGMEPDSMPLTILPTPGSNN